MYWTRSPIRRCRSWTSPPERSNLNEIWMINELNGIVCHAKKEVDGLVLFFDDWTSSHENGESVGKLNWVATIADKAFILTVCMYRNKSHPSEWPSITTFCESLMFRKTERKGLKLSEVSFAKFQVWASYVNDTAQIIMWRVAMHL